MLVLNNNFSLTRPRYTHSLAQIVRWLLGVTSVCLFLFSGYLLFCYASHGFDFTDEGFYLLVARQPQNQQITTSHFGHITTYLYQLSDHNITMFRRLGMVILFFSSFIFAFAAETYWASWTQKPFCFTSILPITLSAAIYYGLWWLLTPSYNWLDLLGTLWVGAGLLFAFSAGAPSVRGLGLGLTKTTPLRGLGLGPTKTITLRRLGLGLTKTTPLRRLGLGPTILLISAGGVLTCMAKPSTAAMLSVITLLWVAYHPHKIQYKLLFLLSTGTLAGALLSLHILFNFGHYHAFIAALQKSVHLVGKLQTSYQFSELWQRSMAELGPLFRGLLKLWVFDLILIGSAYVFITRRFNLGPTKKHRISSLISILYVIVWGYWFVVIAQWLGLSIQITPYSADSIHILFYLIACLALLRFVDHAVEGAKNVSRPSPYMLCLFLFLLTLAYGFGTNNNLLNQTQGAAIFLIACLCYLARPRYTVLLNNLIALSILCVLYHSYYHPYRVVGDISQQTQPVHFLFSNDAVYVEPKTFDYIEELEKIAQAAGWKNGTPLIDLTGVNPGVAAILNARILSSAWFLGGYPGSNDFARALLMAQSPTLLQKAWILVEPTGKRALDLNLLQAVGIRFPAHYTCVGHLKDGSQQLWKPRIPPL